MGRVIEGQAVASTALDRQGERLTEAELRHLFAQMPPERFLNLNHDLTAPPVARAYNTRLEQRGDVLAIASDIEILDEDALQAAGVRGFSISYHRAYPSVEPGTEAVVVSFNPHSLDREAIEAAVDAADLPPGWVAITERADKALFETLAMIYIITHGFFEEAGADLYRLWKSLVKEALQLDRSARVVLRAPPSGDTPEILLQPDPDTDVDALTKIDIAGLVEQARQLCEDDGLIKVVIETDSKGLARIEVAIDGRGKPHREAERD